MMPRQLFLQVDVEDWAARLSSEAGQTIKKKLAKDLRVKAHDKYKITSRIFGKFSVSGLSIPTEKWESNKYSCVLLDCQSQKRMMKCDRYRVLVITWLEKLFQNAALFRRPQ